MNYKVFYMWNDKKEDCLTCYSAAERDLTISDILAQDDVIYLWYCKFYKNGDLGKCIIVK